MLNLTIQFEAAKKLIRKTGLLVVVVALLVASFALGPKAEAQSGPAINYPPRGSDRSLTVPKVIAAPVIDGVMDEAAWGAAVQADQFWISLEGRPPTDRTEVLVMADAANLYFGFRVYDSEADKISALQTRRDAGLGMDDRVTVELDPFRSFNADATSKFSVSARGTQHAEIGAGRAQQLIWKGDWKAAAK